MTEPNIVVSTDNGVRWLRLNRARKLNALDPALMSDLADEVNDAENDAAVSVVVVTGNGRAFCAGGDLNNFRTKLAAACYDEIVDGIRASGEALNRLAACSKPTIAAVNGAAVAGGLEMLLCCDVVLAVEGALIGDGHLRYGVLPGGGGSVRLVRKLPPNVAKWLLLTGSLVPAERFVEWGVVTEVVAADVLTQRTQELAEGLADLSPLALSHVKRVADHAVDGPIDVALKLEQEAFASYVRSDDFAEGVRSFADKRTPRFTGR